MSDLVLCVLLPRIADVANSRALKTFLKGLAELKLISV